jgi:hypothetical protein
MPKTKQANTTAIVPYTDSGARASRVGSSPHTQTLRNRVNETFGVDVSQFGNLNPDMVRNMSISAQVAEEQFEMLQIYIEAAKKRGMIEAEIEKMRAAFLKDADKTLKELDKTFQGAVLLNARHENHMRLIGARTNGALQEIRQYGDQGLTAYQRQLTDKLKASRQVHQFSMQAAAKEISAGTQMQIRELRDRPMQLHQAQTEKANFMSYLTGKPKALLPANKKSFGGWFK